MQKYLFLDLDECMVHSHYASDEKHADELLDMYSEHWFGVKFHIRHDGWYVSFKRNWTDRLMKFARETYGNDNVFILSQAQIDYVLWVNKYLDLGFDPNTNIYGREDIEVSQGNPKFKDSFNVLMDNESFGYHRKGYRNKVKFLNNLPMEQYIKVDKFDVWTEPLGSQDEYLEYVKNRIVETFSNEV